MPTVAFHTLGCKVNAYDTEGIWQMFHAAGWELAPFDGQADVYVINTCTVTNMADRKSRQAIRKAVRMNPEATVVVTGCYAQVAPAEVAAQQGVDLVVGNDRKSLIVQLVTEMRQEQHPYVHPRESVGNILQSVQFEEMDVPYFAERTRATLKIQDGCNHFCTFCIIPRARGLIRSRQPASVLAQAHKLAAAGYREIVLTGIHTGGYGEDLPATSLARLLQDLETVDQLVRYRLSSIEASEIDDELIQVMANSRKMCRHLHIPLQSGHDDVLRRMNRRYRVEEYAATLTRLRQVIPNLAVTTDVIVGFPGETDQQFAATEQFLRTERFAQLHVFPFSRRRGTPAARFDGQVAEEVKEQRVARLIALSGQLTADYASQFVDSVLDVIAERPPAGDRSDYLVGYADNYLRVSFAVPPGQAREALIGEMVRVRVVSTGADVQQGQWLASVTVNDEWWAKREQGA